MSSKSFFRIYVIIAMLCWLLICALEYFQFHLHHHVPKVLINTLLTIQYVVIFLVFKMQVGAKKIANFNELLWQVFVVGGATILLSLLLKYFNYLFPFQLLKNNDFITNVLYHGNSTLMVIFLANGFYVWKKLILYQKTKTTLSAWNVFELLVLLSALSNFLDSDIYSLKFFIATLPMTILGVFLTFNLKWVAFLNYNQKWQSISFIILIMIIIFTYLQQIFIYRLDTTIVLNMANNMFTLGNFAFLIINCTASLLVLLFHLPTSSVFEKKFGEVMIFQKLSQTISMGNSKEEVYEMLLESSISTVMADAGWLEIVDEKGNYNAFLNSEIEEYDIFEIKKVIRKNNIHTGNEPHYIQDIKEYPHTERIKKLPYKAVLIIPLMGNNQKLGTLILLKNIRDGFDKEMVDITYSFVSQASLAIKNFKLIDDVLEGERYQEERKIAKEVQKSLFPQNLMMNIDLELTAFTKAADAVGGDYYDIYKISDHKLAVVIGDVSGNGTSAAFNMAQMKGVFHSLVQLDLQADQFMTYANNALSKCLEKTSFITLSLFYIDTLNKSIEFARAGHCPALFFKKNDNNCEFLQSKGLGLGIIRTNGYAKHIENVTLSYQAGDIMLLYTDGIIEAQNKSGEEYGYERLKGLICSKHDQNIKSISDNLVNDLYAFTETNLLSDDYSFLIIRFI